MITLITIPILTSILTLVGNYDNDYYLSEDNIEVMKLRRILLTSYDININYDELTFNYQDEDWILRMSSSGNLFMTKNETSHGGVQIYLYNVEDLRFYEEDNCIFVYYKRKNNEYKFNLCTTQGLYLDEFSDCLSDDSNDNNSE